VAEVSMIVDRRCSLCQRDGKTSIYRMIGGCRNCGSSPILGLFSVTHEAGGGRCPRCGCDRLHWDRLATEDEIPQAFEGGDPDDWSFTDPAL
jgi:hypothetical protein